MGRYKNEILSESDRQALDRGLCRPLGVRIVLIEPRIPQNTGAIARLCAATGSHLDLINPFFKIDDKKLKRAGLDYWPHLNVKIYSSFEEWEQNNPNTDFWFIEVGGKKIYTEATYQAKCALVFGDEQEGIPSKLLKQYPDRHLHIPQINVRSINLACCVSLVTFEAYRQIGFPYIEA